MRNITERQVALCWLLLKCSRWVPVSLSRKLTAKDRSSPDGPIIMAEVRAEVEAAKIVRWLGICPIYREIAPDGEVLPLDMGPVTRDVGAWPLDALVKASNVVGINELLAQRKLPDHLRRSAFARAATQILDRLRGSKTVGVTLAPNPEPRPGHQKA